MEAVKVSFPLAAYRKMMALAKKLGYFKRGQRWQLLDFLFEYADAHPSLFRKR